MEDRESGFQISPTALGTRLGMNIVLAETALSAAGIAEREGEGSLLIEGREDGEAFLEAGGTVIASGRIVKRFGRNFFKVDRMFTDAAREEEK